MTPVRSGSGPRPVQSSRALRPVVSTRRWRGSNIASSPSGSSKAPGSKGILPITPACRERTLSGSSPVDWISLQATPQRADATELMAL